MLMFVPYIRAVLQAIQFEGCLSLAILRQCKRLVSRLHEEKTMPEYRRIARIDYR